MQKRKVLSLAVFILTLIAQFSGYSFAKEFRANGKSSVIQFKSYGELNEKEKRIAEIVYQWAKKESNVPIGSCEKKVDPDFGISKRDISIGFTDLNNDQQLDAMAVLGRTSCGSGGCALTAFIAPNFYPVSIDTSAFLALPVKTLAHQTQGFKDIAINNKAICTFSKSKRAYACHF